MTTPAPRERRFPDGFLWGSATAAHQVEGNNANNDWWAAEAVSYYCLLVAFGWLAPPILPFAAVGVANFAFAVPGAPAGVGTFHMPVSSLLADHFGAEPSMAAAYAVVLHLAVLAPVPLIWVALAARSRWLAVMAPAPIRIS